MPELPEVETTRRGIAPHIEGKRVSKVIVRQKQLRYPVPSALSRELPGNVINRVERRGKYLLLMTDAGTVIIHLGMSGNLRLYEEGEAVSKHDHFDLLFEQGGCLRLNDPRRFGAVLWHKGDVMQHKLLSTLGPEPLSKAFTAKYLYELSRGRKVAVKQFIMDNHVVVGVGNIYASEALFLAGIRPQAVAGKVSLPRYELLTQAIVDVLRAAIKQGGTTLKDFVDGEGKPGYFKQQLNVYGREGEPCLQCGTKIKQVRQGQRATYYCPSCQRR